ARDRSQRHRHLLRRRLHQQGDLQPHLPGDRRRVAVGLPVGARADGGAQLLPVVGHAAGGGGGGAHAIEQFWRRRRGGGFLGWGSVHLISQEEKTSDDHQTKRRLHHG